MPRTRLSYRPYGELRDEPNVIVDGSPTPATTLTLSHWPGVAAPTPELWADLSAEMAFRYLDHPAQLHGPAEAVSVNHFDQDGLSGLFALVEPDAALARRERLEDLAAAGDFAVVRHRDAARASIVISAFSNPTTLKVGPRTVCHSSTARPFVGAKRASLMASSAACAAATIRVRSPMP